MYEGFWDLFMRTGNIGAYLAYKQIWDNDEEPNEEDMRKDGDN